ncbi:hypothetical protein TNCV_1782141 [Trichonephila clavipes]|nr:hypothetical protein TNCV_1782141 [Trichonephila clavipes]
MRTRAYCAHPSVHDRWALRCMSRCPDQVLSLKRDIQSPSKLGTHLSTHCSRNEWLSQPCIPREYSPDLWCESAIRYHSTTGPIMNFINNKSNPDEKMYGLPIGCSSVHWDLVSY